MARIFGTGFEGGDLSLWTVSGAPTINSAPTYSLTGSYCAYMGNSQLITRDLGSNKTEIFVAFKVKRAAGGGTACMRFLDSGGTQVAFISFNSSNQLSIGQGSTVSKSSVATFPSTTIPYLIEIHYIPLNSGGTFEVKVDGVTVVSIIPADGLDTTGGLENVRSITFGFSTGLTICQTYFDDIVIDDANWIGQTFIQSVAPTGAGSVTQWTPSTGSNYACVDEIPAVDTDFNSTNATGSIDTFETSDLTGSIETVKAVYLQSRGNFSGSPVPKNLQLGVRLGGSNYFSTDLPLSMTFGGFSKTIEINPATMATWTESEINAMEIGYKATA